VQISFILAALNAHSVIYNHISWSSGVSQRHKISVSFVKRVPFFFFFSRDSQISVQYIEGTRVGWATIRI